MEESEKHFKRTSCFSFFRKAWYCRRPFQIVSFFLVMAVIVAVVVPTTRPSGSSPSSPPTLSPLPSSTPSAPPSSIFAINIEIKLDDYPGDTGWTLECDDFELRSVPSTNYTIPHQLVEETFYVREGAECVFRISVSDGGGICCDWGQGYYKLYGGGGGEDNTTLRSNVFAEGGQFEAFAVHEFVASWTWLLSLLDSPTTSTAPRFMPTCTPAPTQRPWLQIGPDIVGSTMAAEAGKSVSLSIDGTVLAIGQFEDGEGSVRIVTQNGTTWTQLGQIIRGENDDDEFGHSVALSGDGMVVAVGGPRNDADFKLLAGHVRVFQYNQSTMTWTPLGQEIVGDDTEDYFGCSVSLSTDGSILACGAPKTSELGYVRVYQHRPLGWSEIGDGILGESANDKTGSSISLSDDGLRLAIASPQHSGIQLDQSGRVRAFQLENNNTWKQVGQSNDGSDTWQFFGTSVALAGGGNIIAIGAGDAIPAFVRVFQYDISLKNWTQLGPNIVGEYDQFGKPISLSKDGNVLVVGAPSGGFTRILQYDAERMSWDQVGQDIFGDLDGKFGLSTSTSGNGSVVAIGAPKFEGPGAVQAFSRD